MIHPQKHRAIYCTAYGFLGHSLKEDCATITISLKGVSKSIIADLTTYFKEKRVYISTLKHGVLTLKNMIKLFGNLLLSLAGLLAILMLNGCGADEDGKEPVPVNFISATPPGGEIAPLEWIDGYL